MLLLFHNSNICLKKYAKSSFTTVFGSNFLLSQSSAFEIQGSITNVFIEVLKGYIFNMHVNSIFSMCAFMKIWSQMQI